MFLGFSGAGLSLCESEGRKETKRPRGRLQPRPGAFFAAEHVDRASVEPDKPNQPVPGIW